GRRQLRRGGEVGDGQAAVGAGEQTHHPAGVRPQRVRGAGRGDEHALQTHVGTGPDLPAGTDVGPDHVRVTPRPRHAREPPSTAGCRSAVAISCPTRVASRTMWWEISPTSASGPVVHTDSMVFFAAVVVRPMQPTDSISNWRMPSPPVNSSHAFPAARSAAVSAANFSPTSGPIVSVRALRRPSLLMRTAYRTPSTVPSSWSSSQPRLLECVSRTVSVLRRVRRVRGSP